MKMFKNPQKKISFSDFNKEQQKQIKHAMSLGHNVTPIANPKLTPFQMEMITQGVSKHWDISYLTQDGLNESQSMQIFQGLRSGIDVSSYAKVEYNSEQMKELRWAIEAGLDITTLAHSEIPAKKMHIMREELAFQRSLNPSVKAPSTNNRLDFATDFAIEAKELALMITEDNGDLYDLKKQARIVLDLVPDIDIENESSDRPEYGDGYDWSQI